MRRVKTISHEDEVSLVEHLDELRARIVVSLAVFGVALALCFWQNHLLLELANGPLPADHDKLITFGVSEPFTTTMTVSAYGAIVLSLPIILYQVYAYLLPAFSQQQQRRDRTAAADDPGPLHRRRRLRLLRRPAGGDEVPAQLQRRPVQHPGAGASDYYSFFAHDAARLRRRLPGPGRGARGDQPGHRQRRASCNRTVATPTSAARSSPPPCRASTRSRCCWRRHR